MINLGLIGFPLEHSYSPAYFREKLKNLNLVDRVSYKSYPLKRIEDLSALIERHNLRGLNITIPHKKSALKLASTLDDWSQKSGSINTILVEKNGVLRGYNTDAPGFIESLYGVLHQLSSALILGTGGAACAVRVALQEHHIKVTTVSRSTKGDLSYSELNINNLPGFDLIVNCTPLGTWPNTDSLPPIPYELIRPNQILYDLVYNPSETLFLGRGKEKGCRIFTGLPMLQNQAERSWEIWKEGIGITEEL